MANGSGHPLNSPMQMPGIRGEEEGEGGGFRPKQSFFFSFRWIRLFKILSPTIDDNFSGF